MENDGPLKWGTKGKTFPMKTSVKDLCGSYFLIAATKVQALGAWFKNRGVIIITCCKDLQINACSPPQGYLF